MYDVDMAGLERVEKRNLSERVYEEIRGALMNGQYVPGDRLRIATLAESLGTSITPVREAIFRLVSEKALEITASTSVMVPQLDPGSLREIQLMRRLLEGSAAARAAELATARDVEALVRVQEKFIRASATNPSEAARRNRDFHFGLMAVAQLPNLFDVVESMWVRMGPLLNTFHTQVPKRNIFNDHHPHFKVLEALRANNAEKAEQAIAEDIDWGERVLIEWMSGRSVDKIFSTQ